MKKLHMIASAGVTSVVIAGLVVTPVLACHPQGKIVKTVQGVTTKSQDVDANTNDTALTVNKGDTLTYTITVSNQETNEGKQHQADMTKTVLTDTLPGGVELVSNPSQRVLTTDLGTIKAKGSVVKTVTVKVTESTDGAVLTNYACYTSDSNLGKKFAQNGCDVATVTVHVPDTPAPTPAPKQTPTPPATTLPNTGAGNMIVPALAACVLGYAGYLRRLNHRAAASK